MKSKVLASLLIGAAGLVHADSPSSLLLRYQSAQGAQFVLELKPLQYNNQTAVLAKNGAGNASNTRPFLQARTPSTFGLLTGSVEVVLIPLDQVQSIEWPTSKDPSRRAFRVVDKNGAAIEKTELKLVVCPPNVDKPERAMCDVGLSPAYTLWLDGAVAIQGPGKDGFSGLDVIAAALEQRRGEPFGRLTSGDQVAMREELTQAQASAKKLAEAEQAKAAEQRKVDDVARRAREKAEEEARQARAREIQARRQVFMKQAPAGTQVVCNALQGGGQTIADLFYECNRIDAGGSFADFQALGWRVSSQTLVPETDGRGATGHRATLIFEKAR